MKRFRVTLLVLGAAASMVLAACGGGGCNPCEQDAPTPHVDCTARPERCR